jgi:hypothetical protein
MPMRRTGAVHRAAPASVPLLAAHANLVAMAPSAGTDWQSRLTLGDPLGNDTLGNCVPCAQLRAEQLFVANAMASSWTPTAADAIALYELDAGYQPGNPATDQGTDTATAMSRWCSQGYAINDQTLDVPRWTKLDPGNLDHIRIAVDTLGSVLLTLNLPRAAMPLDEWTIVPTSDPDTAPGSEGGHRVMCGRHDSDGLWLVTWGLQMLASPGFLAAYCIAADAVVSRRWIEATGLSPAGLDLAHLDAEAAAVGQMA